MLFQDVASNRIVNVEHRDVLPNASVIAHFQQIAGQYGQLGLDGIIHYDLYTPVQADATELTMPQLYEAYDTLAERADHAARLLASLS